MQSNANNSCYAVESGRSGSGVLEIKLIALSPILWLPVVDKNVALENHQKWGQLWLCVCDNSVANLRFGHKIIEKNNKFLINICRIECDPKNKCYLKWGEIRLQRHNIIRMENKYNNFYQKNEE